MKAAIRKGMFLTGYKFEVANDVAKPTFDAKNKNKDQVLVEVQAAGINPVDYKAPKMMMGDTIGLDFCGTVAEVGAAIESSTAEGAFAVGDVVYGVTKGSVAEYCVADPKAIAKAPEGWKATECAALPVAYISTLQCLRAGNVLDADAAKDRAVLVVGASGGCGIAGLQFCNALGVGRIIAICSSRNAEYVREYGATEVVDYTNEAELDSFFADNKGQIDCVFDAASEGKVDYRTPSLALLKKNEKDEIVGQYTALNGSNEMWTRKMLGMEKPNHHIIVGNPNREDLEKTVELMNTTGARPPVNEMPFDEEGFEEAFQLLRSKRSKGKIVLGIKN